MKNNKYILVAKNNDINNNNIDNEINNESITELFNIIREDVVPLYRRVNKDYASKYEIVLMESFKDESLLYRDEFKERYRNNLLGVVVEKRCYNCDNFICLNREAIYNNGKKLTCFNTDEVIDSYCDPYNLDNERELDFNTGEYYNGVDTIDLMLENLKMKLFFNSAYDFFIFRIDE